jgi:hypothetical protein
MVVDSRFARDPLDRVRNRLIPKLSSEEGFAERPIRHYHRRAPQPAGLFFLGVARWKC